MEQRKSSTHEKGKAQAEQTSVRQNTEGMDDGGLVRSSEEAPVMGVERRGEVIQLKLALAPARKRGKTNGAETKGIGITKRMVWEAYKKVKRKKGAGGIGEQSIADFEAYLRPNLYVLWNRLTSGSYRAPNVLKVEISKSDGGTRTLGVPTVSDRIAQQVVKNLIEPKLEAVFSNNSYGYRPGRNAHHALESVRQNVWKHKWVIDMDISKFFDEVDHGLMQKALDLHVKEKGIRTYITQWLEAPREDRKGEVESTPGKGTPQGGVISPLLANLYLHYVLDKWLELKYPGVKFVRYADDVIVHCDTKAEAEQILQSIKDRLGQCHLSLNEKKTRIVYCGSNRPYRKEADHTAFDFLGYSFKLRTTARKSGGLFQGYDCEISQKSEKKIIGEIRASSFQTWTGSELTRIIEHFNPKIIGWINYYGKFRRYRL
ncbi:MAG: RNA-directed DNA polymerase [Patiriisocius sp.]|jgi:RNA-directed DNA polymerase